MVTPLKRILIIGGYGNFGYYIARRLGVHAHIQLIIAGRSLEKAKAACRTLSAANPPQPARLDITGALDATLADIKPDITIHTSGPFQGQDSFVAQACIKTGSHYIDLADARAFVNTIGTLDAAAQQAGLLVVSGASSVPCLSSALMDAYLPHFGTLESVHYGIGTAQKTNRGLATTKAVLSYAGEMFTTLIDGRMQPVWGWQSLRRYAFKGAGTRLMGNCDIPDLDIFPARYPGLKTQRFYAGLEVPFIHVGLWGLTWLRRMRLLPRLDALAPMLLKASFLFDHFGTGTSAFFMQLAGTAPKDTPPEGTTPEGTPKHITFELIARSADGPYIPCTPAILLAEKLASGTIATRGSMPCVGLITATEYLNALQGLDISWQADTPF